MAASIKLVYPMPWAARELGTISASPRRRACSWVNARQIKPRACTAMNVTAGASTCSAAISNEPSPLCSSSVITIFSPLRKASINWPMLSRLAKVGGRSYVSASNVIIVDINLRR